MRATSSNFVSVVAISNTSEINRSPGSLRISNVDVPTEPYEKMVVPSAQPNIVGPTCASLGVTSVPSLDARFSEFQATILRAGGNLYGVLPFGSNDGNGFSRDVLAWFILRPTLTSTLSLTANIVAQGYVVPPDGYSLIYPAIAVNKAGKGLIGFTVSNPDVNAPGGFPSAAVIEFAVPRGNIIVTGQGATSYDQRRACLRPGPGESLRGAIMARQQWMRPPASSTSAMSTFRIRPYFPALRTAIGGPSSPKWPLGGVGRWAHLASARTNLVTDVADCRRLEFGEVEPCGGECYPSYCCCGGAGSRLFERFAGAEHGYQSSDSIHTLCLPRRWSATGREACSEKRVRSACGTKRNCASADGISGAEGGRAVTSTSE
jgi:hypothetical protein